MENGVVGVDNRSGGGDGREGGVVPVFVGWEYGRLGFVLDLDYESFTLFLL